MSPKPLTARIGHSDKGISGCTCNGDGAEFNDPSVGPSNGYFATHANRKVAEDGNTTIANRVVIGSQEVLVLARTIDSTDVELTAVWAGWTESLGTKGEGLCVAGVPTATKGVETWTVFQRFNKFCTSRRAPANKHRVRGAGTRLYSLNWIQFSQFRWFVWSCLECRAGNRR